MKLGEYLSEKLNRTYSPIGSSYKLRQVIPINDYVNNIFSTMHFDGFQHDSYAANFNVYIQNKSSGEVFNAYEKVILNSQWDCRDNGDYQTILLGREYMFYNVDGKITSKNINDIPKEDLVFEIKYQTPVSFFPYINKIMIDNGITAPFDVGTAEELTSGNQIKTDKKDVRLKKLLNRDECRKFSENHFAISCFNLIGHSISVNSNVPNTVSEIYKDSKKNTISILGDTDNQYVVEISATPELPSSSIYADEENEHRNDEFLANKLLEELRYCYQGNIIIKFNPDIEIGDTIMLMDNVSSIYGVFQVDSYEHSLDQRGLITSLIVKASWNPKDPILDYHSQTIGYKLVDVLKTKFNLTESVDKKNAQVNKLMSLYLKYVVQAPKYCVFYKKKEETFLNPSTVAYNNISSPTALPLRFFPMIVKGVPQIPKNIKYAFVSGVANNNISDILSGIAAKLSDTIKAFWEGFTSASIKTLYFVSDMLLSTITFNMSELLKPLFGITTSRAVEGTYDKINEIDSEDVVNMLKYNPYEKKYKLLYQNFDLTLGFFNVRLQKEDDLYAANKSLPRNAENNKVLIDRKVQVVRKMLNDVFDSLFLVELYDGFKVNVGDSSMYTFEKFLEDCSSGISPVSHKEIIASNTFSDKQQKTSVSNEYGAVLKNSKVNFEKYERISLAEGGRYAIEVTYDVSDFKLSAKQSVDVLYIKKLKIVFFHNLYGASKDDKGVNSVDIRRNNVRYLIEKYRKYAVNSSDIGVIIMADFNLDVYNNGEKPNSSSAFNQNYTYELPDNSFIAQIKSPTTLNQYGYLKGNKYDNVLLSKNINGLVSAKVFEYPEKDKLTISDHIPIYVGIKKMQG